MEKKMLQTALTFDDVLLVPKYSSITSRSEVDLRVNLDPTRQFSLPVISSPMDTVTEVDMCVAMSNHGGLGIIHRYNSIQEQVELVKDAKLGGASIYVGAAVGSTGDYHERALELFKNGVDVICVDVAHGHHQNVKEALDKLQHLKDTAIGTVHIMAGNVATGKAFQDLSDWGADSIRVGIGGGSICSTRIQTGFGVPNLAAIFDCAQTQAYKSGKTKLIVDGGIKNSGDMVKAFAAGAHFVMCGSLLAGTDESPGEMFIDGNGVKMKNYRGMASREAQTDWRGKSSAPEGISTFIKHKGSVNPILDDIRGNIQSGFSYAGARNFTELSGKVQFIQQTSAGAAESFTHILHKR
jgi:IMP dehydrogenase